MHCRMFSSPCLRVIDIHVHGGGWEGRRSRAREVTELDVIDSVGCYCYRQNKREAPKGF